jgi:serine/threonine-protein kinase RsbW
MGSARSKPRDDQPRKPNRGTLPLDRGNNGTMKFVIASDPMQQRDVQKRILDAIESAGYHPDNLFAVKISLEEALINAIKHGNKLDPKKQVRVEANITSEQAEIIVEDEGPGFNRAHVPDPTAEENLLKCSGRGILLMETYMDRVEYSKDGRRVRMIKRNARPAKKAQ